MRRAGPFLIVIIAILAIVIDFVALPVPAAGGETRRLETKLGLDLRGGLRIEYQVLPAEGKTPTRDDLDILRSIIVNRIDKSGVAEPQVVIQGNDRVIVEMPGVQNPDQIRGPRGHDRAPRLRPARPDARDAGPAAPRGDHRDEVRRPDHGQLRPVLRRPDRRRLHRRRRDRPAHGQLHARGRRPGQVRAVHGRSHRRLLRDRPRRQRHQRSRDPELDPERAGPDQPGGDRRLPARGGAEPRHHPPVRPAAVPDRRARQHHGQPHPRRGVPAAEPARGSDRDPHGHLLHGRPLPPAGRRGELRADHTTPSSCSRSSASSRSR